MSKIVFFKNNIIFNKMDNDSLIVSNSSQPDNDNGINERPSEPNGQNENHLHRDIIHVKKCFFVELNQGVSHFNLCTFYLVQFSYVCAFTFIDACQDYLLKSPEYYNIDPALKGTVNGDILMFDTLYLVSPYNL
jgi:hypothetical protein